MTNVMAGMMIMLIIIIPTIPTVMLIVNTSNAFIIRQVTFHIKIILFCFIRDMLWFAVGSV